MKKILIVYATAGIGHKKAAIAVRKAFAEMAPGDMDVLCVDALDYTPGFFKWSYLKLYLLAVNKLSALWGFMYYVTDNFYVNSVIRWLRRFNNHLNSRRLIEYLTKLKPDVIVSTHFFASEVVSELKKKGLVSSNLVTVVTDYRLHSWWVADRTDTYVVSNEDARSDLLTWGVPGSKIKVLGIPAEPAFSKALDKARIRALERLSADPFTVLIIGGGFGVGPIEEIVKVVDSLSLSVQAIVICGHNEELIRRIENLKPALSMDTRVFGFVDNVHEFMEVSDILISKAGGITVTESLAKDLPMIVISPIPGQETRNSDFVVKYGAAIKVNGIDELGGVLGDVISHREKIETMRENIRKIKKPKACYDIAILAMDIARRS